jgi:NADP-dependent aldehyde dehydrogenase
MLNSRIHSAYIEAVEKLRGIGGIELSGESAETPDSLRNQGRPTAFSSDGRTFMGNPLLSEEVFGPSTVVIRAADEQQLLQIAAELDGHLTASIHGTPEELQRYGALVAELQRKVGRLIFNGFPTGVEVCGAMNHGGPYPATTDVHFTSVGTAAVYRFARPICYQDFPQSALPPELQDANPLGILRQVDDAYTRKAL